MQKISPLLTIAIPYFSDLHHLRLAIESVLRQSSSEWQCIVIDDCGGESAEPLVSGYCSDKVKYVNNGKTLGLSANWNKAVALSDTPLLTIFHADDEMGENYVLNTIETFKQFPEIAAAHCRARLIDNESNQASSIAHNIKAILRPGNPSTDLLLLGDKGLRSVTLADWIICPTLTYRTEIIKSMTFNTKLKFATDLEFIARLFFAEHQIMGRKEIDYSYRVHKNSQTTKMKNDGLRFLEEWNVVSWIGQVSKLRKWRGTAIWAATKPVLRAHMLYEALRFLRGSRFAPALMLIYWALYKPPKDKLRLFDLN